MKEGFFGFLGGAIIGATAAFLLAPEKGEKIRKEIKKFVDEAVETVKKNADVFIEQGKKQFENVINTNTEKTKKS